MNRKDTWNQEYAEHDAIPSSRREAVSLPLQAASHWIDFDQVETVAEIGCGNGRNTVYLADRDVAVAAIDFSREALKLARNRIAAEELDDIVTLYNADVSDRVPLPDDSVELVVDSYVSCHFLEDEAVERYMEEVERVLVPRGCMYWSGLGVDDEYYGALQATHPEDRIIVDPLNNVAKRLYTQGEVREGMPGAPEAEYSMELTFNDFVADDLYRRHVLAALYRFE